MEASLVLVTPIVNQGQKLVLGQSIIITPIVNQGQKLVLGQSIIITPIVNQGLRIISAGLTTVVAAELSSPSAVTPEIEVIGFEASLVTVAVVAYSGEVRELDFPLPTIPGATPANLSVVAANAASCWVFKNSQLVSVFPVAASTSYRTAAPLPLLVRISGELIEVSPAAASGSIYRVPRKLKLIDHLLVFASEKFQFWLGDMPTLVQSFPEVEYFTSSISGSEITTIFHNKQEELITRHRVTEADRMTANSYITDFRLTAAISSLAEASLPNFSLEQTGEQRTIAALNVKWQSARFHLNIFDSLDGLSWNLIATESLLNSNGYPYTVSDLLDYLTDKLAYNLGNNARIGVALEDAGFGLPTEADKITVRGAVKHEIVVVSAV